MHSVDARQQVVATQKSSKSIQIRSNPRICQEREFQEQDMRVAQFSLYREASARVCRAQRWTLVHDPPGRSSLQ